MNSLYREFRPLTQDEIEYYHQQFSAQSQQSHSSLAWFDSQISTSESQNINDTVAVIDLGGTNLRYAIAQIQQSQIQWLTPLQKEIAQNQHASLHDYVDWLIQKILPLAKQHTVDKLHFILSYPHEPIRFNNHITAIITSETKGIQIPGLIGQDIGKLLLTQAQHAGWLIQQLIILNDTIATTLTQTAKFGLVIGTGGNIASVHPNKPHLRNVEAGNFDAIPHTQASYTLDQQERPGTQTIEKQTTGRYLYRLLIEQLKLDQIDPRLISHIEDISPQYESGLLNYFQSSDFSMLNYDISSEQQQLLTQISNTLLTTSAQAWGLMLAACINLNQLPEQSLDIPVTGGVILNNPHYHQTVQQVCAQLTQKQINLIPTHDSITGAALATIQQ